MGPGKPSPKVRQNWLRLVSYIKKEKTWYAFALGLLVSIQNACHVIHGLTWFAEQFLELSIFLSTSGLMFMSGFEFHDKTISDLLKIPFTAVVFCLVLFCFLIKFFTLQRELLSVTGPMNKLPNEGAASAACTELAEQLALLSLLSLAQLQSSSTLRHPVTQPPSLGHPSFQVPHLFGGQSFTVQAEGKPPIPRNGFSLEIRDVTHALHPPQELTLCRRVPPVTV